MKKKRGAVRKMDVSEAQRVVRMHEAARELEEAKRDVAIRMEAGLTTEPTGTSDTEIGSIIAAGMTPQQAAGEIRRIFNDFMNALAEYVFHPAHRKRFFPDQKAVYLVGLLKGAGYTMQAAAAMDIFKDRVKQKQGGKMPTITEKTGLFGKTTSRPMKLGEIVNRFEIEEHLPPEDIPSLTGFVGTQRGLLDYVRASLFDEEEIRDPIKRNQRKQLTAFLKGAKLLDPATDDRQEKVVVACLLTPEAYQPKSMDDIERILRFRGLLSKGTQYLRRRIKALEAAQAAENTTNHDNSE